MAVVSSEPPPVLNLSAVRDGHISAVPDERRTLTPTDRLSALCDPGSLQIIRSQVTADGLGTKGRPGDGVLAAAGRINGRPVLCYSQDASFLGGSLGHQHAETIVRLLRLAKEASVPVVSFIESGGARLQEGVAALSGYARIFHETVELSGQVPQISIVTGSSAGGGSYSPALTDFVVMTNEANMFLTGPRVVRAVTGENVSTRDLGGPQVQNRNGVCHFTTADEPQAIETARRLLDYLCPSNPHAAPHERPTYVSPAGLKPSAIVPADPRRPYDVTKVIDAIADADSQLEVAPKWAPSMVTAFATLEGRPVAIVANQPAHVGGVIDAESSQKAATFITTTSAFGLPLVVLIDTPGFMPGTAQESAGVIRHGASLLHAFAAAKVPKVSVVLRKSYGGAYITMNSKDLGAHLYLAWSGSEIGIMNAESAVDIIHRRKLEAAGQDAPDLRAGLAATYKTEHLSAAAAARAGYVDEVIDPDDTRQRLSAALGILADIGQTAARARGRA